MGYIAKIDRDRLNVSLKIMLNSRFCNLTFETIQQTFRIVLRNAFVCLDVSPCLYQRFFRTPEILKISHAFLSVSIAKQTKQSNVP